jgi:chitin synthase
MKVSAWSFDKGKVNTSSLAHDSRMLHVFYQLLAGATTAERGGLKLEDPSDYALLASSGTYRLPAQVPGVHKVG